MKRYRVEFEVTVYGDNPADAISLAAAVLEYASPETLTSDLAGGAYDIHRLRIAAVPAPPDSARQRDGLGGGSTPGADSGATHKNPQFPGGEQ